MTRPMAVAWVIYCGALAVLAWGTVPGVILLVLVGWFAHTAAST
jgi:hypothetical protein